MEEKATYSKKNSTYYFAYGSNMSVERIRKRLGRDIYPVAVGVVSGYSFGFTKASSSREGYAFANMTPNGLGIAWGVLYEVEDKDIAILDKSEGFPKHYKKIEIEVKIPTGKDYKVKCFAYISTPEYLVEDRLMKVTTEYAIHILKGCRDLHSSYKGEVLSMLSNQVE